LNPPKGSAIHPHTNLRCYAEIVLGGLHLEFHTNPGFNDVKWSTGSAPAPRSADTASMDRCRISTAVRRRRWS